MDRLANQTRLFRKAAALADNQTLLKRIQEADLEALVTLSQDMEEARVDSATRSQDMGEEEVEVRLEEVVVDLVPLQHNQTLLGVVLRLLLAPLDKEAKDSVVSAPKLHPGILKTSLRIMLLSNK